MGKMGDSERNYLQCSHSWVAWFGPVLKCSHCGAETITSASRNESKPIFKPAALAGGEG